MEIEKTNERNPFSKLEMETIVNYNNGEKMAEANAKKEAKEG